MSDCERRGHRMNRGTCVGCGITDEELAEAIAEANADAVDELTEECDRLRDESRELEARVARMAAEVRVQAEQVTTLIIPPSAIYHERNHIAAELLQIECALRDIADRAGKESL